MKLSNFEFNLLFMSIRYAMNRKSIYSASLPADIITNWYHRISNNEKKLIVHELRENLKFNENISFEYDKKIWNKFMEFLDWEKHHIIKTINNEEIKVFSANGRIYSIDSYKTEAYKEIYIPYENIVII